MIFNFVLRGKSNNYIMNKLFDLPLLTSIIGSILITEASMQWSYLFTIWSLLNSFASCYYHYTEECCCNKLDVGISGISVMFIFFVVQEYRIVLDFYTSLILCIGFFFLGKSWGNCRPRKNNYFINHSIFHLLVSYSFRIILLKIASLPSYKQLV